MTAAAYAHSHGKSVHSGLPGRAAPLPAGAPISVLADGGPFGAALAVLLLEVLTPQRFEPWNAANDHRAYPSPRAAYPVRVRLRTPAGAWVVDPVRRTLSGPGVPAVGDTARLDFDRGADRLPPGYGDLAVALAELETGHLGQALADAAIHFGLIADLDADGVALTGSGNLRSTTDSPWRSSGIGPRGLAADPRPLPASALRLLADAVPESPLRHRIAVRGVDGLAGGWYAPHPLRLVEPAAATAAVQAAFTYPRTQIDVTGMNVAWVITADVAAAVAERGQDAYPALLRAAGAAGQRICAAAARAGLFCRPARSVREPELEAAAHAPPGHDFLYLLLAGRPRTRGVGYDLTPVKELP
ncbi:hypothetical protein [Actinokineospora sp.]|uniref:hypothetical protein n=1 Tax=Actinokineospora sp. TaxID=1872133 RepID=UPI0040380FD9